MTITSLPPGYTVDTYVETVYAAPEPARNTSDAGRRPHFSRWTTTVRDAAGNYVSSSGDREDAINQALAIAQADLQ
jgi:hypothetical protein